MKRIILALIILSAWACKKYHSQAHLQNKVAGQWVVAYDTDYNNKEVFHYIKNELVVLDIQPDSIMTIKKLDADDTKKTTWEMQDKTRVTFKDGGGKTHQLSFDVQEDILKGGGTAIFGGIGILRRVADAKITQSKEEIRQILQNTSWQSEGRELHFNPDLLYTNSQKEPTEVRCWHIRKYEDYAFLYQSGNPDTCGGYIGRIMQITDLQKDKLSLSVRNEIAEYEADFTPTSPVDMEALAQNPPFQRCDLHSRVFTSPIDIYADFDNHFYDNYVTPPNCKNETGRIWMDFYVNCKGIGGDFKIAHSENAKGRPYTFKKEITDQLIQIGESIDQWQMKHKDDVNGYMDFQGKTNFEFVNGKIVSGRPPQQFPKSKGTPQPPPPPKQ